MANCKKTILLFCFCVLSVGAFSQKCNLVSAVSKYDALSAEDTASGVGDDGIYTIREPEVFLNVKDKQRYSCRNLSDFNLRTAWVMDTSEQSKVVVSYKFDLSAASGKEKAFRITKLFIVNGYRKSALVWVSNSRVRYVNMSIGNRLVGRVELADTYKMQSVDVTKLNMVAFWGKVLEVSLTFDGFYAGTKFPNDIAISEIKFEGERFQ